MKLFLYYILFINLYGIFIMYLDKSKSKKGNWRIPERRLFTIAFACGSLGIFIGMYLFRHKTKHGKFIIGIPLIFIIETFIFFKYIYKFIILN